MPLTVFDFKGVPSNRRERIEPAIVAGGRHVRKPHEVWIAMNPLGILRMLITGPDGLERSVGFAPDEGAAVISEMVRASLED
jgi:hypothetical protein